VRHVAERQRMRETRLVDGIDAYRAARHRRGQLARRLHDVPAPAVAHCHLHLEAGVRRGQLFRRGHARLQLHRQRLAFADEAQPHAVAIEFVDFAIERIQEQLHEAADFDGRPVPVLAREGEQRERFHLAARALLDAHAHRSHALAMSGMARLAAGFGPAPVAVHDDRDVAGNAHVVTRASRAQTCMISFSLAASCPSMSPMYLSVSFWMSTSAFFSSSWEISFSLSASLTSVITSRRTLRTATRAFSASARTTLVMSRRRSSVSGGSGRRITVPALTGLRPSSDL